MTAIPPAVATSQSGKMPSVQRDFQATAGLPSGSPDFLPLISGSPNSVEEVAREQDPAGENEQKA